MENLSAIEQARQLFARSWAAYSQGELKEAEEFTLQAKAIWEREMGPESLPVSTCMNNLGRICEETDRPEEGIEWHRKALALRKKLLGDHPETAFCYGNLGTALAAYGKFEEAIDVLSAAISLFEKCGNTNGHDVEGYRKNLDVCVAALTRPGG
ncbi:MAG: tetratricopeptide repeat protein [Mailhella sp.]|nr:tetratricopeptide repeat protein [Mailhella sp.]MBR6673512.1 tetratricopeptide repeat protein [Mailhella sp.]